MAARAWRSIWPATQLPAFSAQNGSCARVSTLLGIQCGFSNAWQATCFRERFGERTWPSLRETVLGKNTSAKADAGFSLRSFSSPAKYDSPKATKTLARQALKNSRRWYGRTKNLNQGAQASTQVV